ncbi:MAG: hypothetical protein FHK80_07210 [Azoarcus sp. PHD]|nr:MAG: hypothetical protein FHK80_07210 [Azoarcus sp. PHD]
MTLAKRLDRLEARKEAAEPPAAALVLLSNCDEAAERAKFEQIHGRPPALVIRCTLQDARIPDEPMAAPAEACRP